MTPKDRRAWDLAGRAPAGTGFPAIPAARVAPAAGSGDARVGLGMAAGLSVLGLRACGPAGAHRPCAAAVRAYALALGSDGAAALSCFIHLVRSLAHRGRRAIRLAIPGADGVTADELSALAALNAAQTGDAAAADHLVWLFGGPVPPMALAAVETAAGILAGRGYWVATPAAAPRPNAPTPPRVVAAR